MIKTNWQKGTLVEPARVLSDGTIQPAQYEGATPLSPEMLNQMEDNIESAILETENEINNLNEQVDSIGQRWTYYGGNVGTTYSANGWRNAFNPITTPALEQGTYLVIMGFTGRPSNTSNSGVSTIRITLDGVEYNNTRRQSVYAPNGNASYSGVVSTTFEVSELQAGQTKQLGLQIYPTVNWSSSYSSFIELIKLS